MVEMRARQNIGDFKSAARRLERDEDKERLEAKPGKIAKASSRARAKKETKQNSAPG
jgi:hypothetical protein